MKTDRADMRRACVRLFALCACALLWLPAAARAQAQPSGGAPALALSQAEQAYFDEHPVLIAAYGGTWEPLVNTQEGPLPTGIATEVLDRLAEAAGVQLAYVPLETAVGYDMLLCVPHDPALAARTGLVLSAPYITLSLALVTHDGRAAAVSAVADGAFPLPGTLAGVPDTLTYADGARACLDMVLDERQPAAVLNRYAAERMLLGNAYATLAVAPLPDAVSACFAVPDGADARLLSSLSKLAESIREDERTDLLVRYALQNQVPNLAALANRMPADVALVSLAVGMLLLGLVVLLIVYKMRSRRERAHAAEIAAFLDYANKVNDDVWEVNVRTFKRWRYRIQNGALARLPMPDLSEAIVRGSVHAADIAAVLARVEAVIAGGVPHLVPQQRFECRIAGAGGYRWSRIVFQGMMPTPGHPACVMVFIMDIDDAVRAEERKNEQLRQALAEAESLSRARGAFAAYVSHEIRSPLNALLGYLTLAKSSIDDPQRLSDCFVKSEYAATHLLQLVGDVLDMGSLERGKLRLTTGSFDAHRLLDTLAAIYNAQAKSRGIDYRVEAGLLPEQFLIGDELRVKQVIVNLLSNAMKFTPTGGRVTLSASQLSADAQTVALRFTVADTGIGMAEGFQQTLFAAYTQSEAALSGHFGGSGLGLSIAKQLVGLMGGEISVVSAEGKGTTFTVDIPCRIDTATRAQAQNSTQGRNRFAGKRLLLVEDNDMNMEIAAELLRLEGGFLIDEATNGSEALRRFTQSPAGTYCAILMDVHMPVMDGYEATRRIRASAHADAAIIPIWAMTANAFDEDVRLAREAGMDGHIPKPFDIHKLLDALSACL